MTVLISGAGIGGLSLGLTLHQLGIPFRIYEAVTELRPLGVGINVQPHAVRELYELGLEHELDACGIRTREVAYFSAQGGLIWSEPRGQFAGYHWPQFSVHRGRFQMMLVDALVKRAGPEVIVTGHAVADWFETDTSVTATLVDRKSAAALGQVTGDVLIGCDGINSTLRAGLFPDEGPAHWSGVMMWRGVTLADPFLTGASMAMAGSKRCKFVCYPIATAPDGRAVINWICDRGMEPDHPWQKQDWNRAGQVLDFLPLFEEWHFDWLDVPAIIRGAERVFEYPMVDRNPLPRWSNGRVTLLGDAAHAMYPIGSNGASQAILDARHLGRAIAAHGAGETALALYDDERRAPVNALVLANRGDGPDKVLDVVAERAPNGFAEIDTILPRSEREDMAARYKAIAGFEADALNARPSIIGDRGV